MIDFNSYRKLFPITEKQTWLNHASISPFSTRVSKGIEDFIFERQFGEIDFFPKTLQKIDDFKTEIGKLINAPKERIGYLHNTSEGLLVLASGLDWKVGDRVLLNDIEFPANVYPFLNLKSKGVEIDFVKNRSGRILVEDLEKAITPKTKVLSISFVNFANGFRSDLEKIGELCKSKGIIFCVDGIQGVGAVPLDVQKYKIDFLSNGCNKWLMGLQGTAFVFVTEELQNRIASPFTSWLSVKHFWDFFDYRLENLFETPQRYQFGTHNCIGVWGTLEAVKLLNEIGKQNIWEKVQTLTKKVRNGILESTLKLETPFENENELSGIVSFSSADNEKIYKKLKSESITIALRDKFLRVSPHFYNTEEEIEKLLAVLKK